MSKLSIKSTELHNHVWIVPSPAMRTACKENVQNIAKCKKLHGVVKVEFSPTMNMSMSAKIRKNEVKGNLKEQET